MNRCLALLLLLLAAALAPLDSFAADEAKARLSNDYEGSVLTFSPIRLTGGSELTLVSPSRWSSVIQRLSTSLSDLHVQYTRIFGEIPPLHTSIRLMEDEEFFRTTGAPRWTNALYYRREIIIPLKTDEPVDWENLSRAVRHEYTHAIVNALSGGRCPGWLDEGLAQWAEGGENPALRPALVKRLRTKGPLPLAVLQGGFTKLDNEIVAAAYAQSLYLARNIIRVYGFKRIADYFRQLRAGAAKEKGFLNAFSVSAESFEKAAGNLMARWAETQENG